MYVRPLLLKCMASLGDKQPKRTGQLPKSLQGHCVTEDEHWQEDTSPGICPTSIFCGRGGREMKYLSMRSSKYIYAHIFRYICVYLYLYLLQFQCLYLCLFNIFIIFSESESKNSICPVADALSQEPGAGAYARIERTPGLSSGV